MPGLLFSPSSSGVIAGLGNLANNFSESYNQAADRRLRREELEANRKRREEEEHRQTAELYSKSNPGQGLLSAPGLLGSDAGEPPPEDSHQIGGYVFAPRSGYKSPEERESEKQQNQFAHEEKMVKLKKEATPSKIDEEVDKKFAPEYINLVVKGGHANATANIKKLQEALPTIQTGRPTDLLPLVARTQLDPEGVKNQQNVESVVQGSLREILGAQYTAKEGFNVLARAYDPRLPSGVTKERVGDLLNQLQEQLDAKMKAAEYYQAHGTLRGYKGPMLAKSINDFMPKEEGKKGLLEKDSGEPDELHLDGKTYRKNPDTGKYSEVQ